MSLFFLLELTGPGQDNQSSVRHTVRVTREGVRECGETETERLRKTEFIQHAIRKRRG